MTTIDVYRGDDWSVTVTITETLNGVTTPLDLTGASLTSTIDGTPGWSGTPTATDAANGVCTVDVPKTATANFAPGVYLADVQVVAGGKTRTAALFQFRVSADITRT